MNSSKSIIRFDGLYRTDVQTTDDGWDMPYYSYILFCENGDVLSAGSVTPSVEKVSKWLNCTTKDVKNFSIGKYEIKGEEISFTVTSVNGKVDYVGVIKEDKVILNSFSHINEHAEENIEYSLFPNKE